MSTAWLCEIQVAARFPSPTGHAQSRATPRLRRAADPGAAARARRPALDFRYRWYLKTAGMRYPTRRSRAARQADTRARLMDCAPDVFLRHGFHAATLETIALQAGVTKGAVYSNFASKAQLFLEVSNARMEERLRLYREMHAAATRLDTFVRAFVRIVLPDDPDGRWASVVAEACAVAAGDETFRAALRGQSARANAVIGEAILDLARKSGVEFQLPKPQMIRVGGALMRGLLLQRLLDPRDMSKASVEDIYVAFMQAMIRPRPGVARFKGNPEQRRMSHDRHVAAPEPTVPSRAPRVLTAGPTPHSNS